MVRDERRWTTRARALAVVGMTFVVALLGTAAAARADGPNAVQNLPACTTTSFLGNDDQSVSLVPLGFTLDFHGQSYSQVNVNNNGNVSFNRTISDFTPFGFTTSSDSIIAPFLADVDTRPAGSALVTYGAGSMPNGDKLFCVNWVDVGYYANHTDKTNSFQLLLTQSPAQAADGNFSITFNYDRVLWETGDASGGSGGFGGTSAAAGYSAGDGIDGHSAVLPGSFTPGALLNGGPAALVAGSRDSGGQAGRYVFQVVNGAETGGRVTGTINRPGGGGEPFAAVQLCPDGGGACIVRSASSNGRYQAGGVPAGTYTMTASAGPDSSSYAPATVSGVSVTTGATTTQDLTLGAAATAPPPEIDAEVGDGQTNGQGVPVIDWTSGGEFTALYCSGALLDYTVTIGGTQIAGGQLQPIAGTESPITGSTRYRGVYPSAYPLHGRAQVHVSGTCPVGGSVINTTFDIYIDPSGQVADQNGTPIAGATVTLLRSDSPSGPFIQVPDGGAEMSPGNRANPDLSRSNGRFGWDVVAGYYVVEARKDGCVSAADSSSAVVRSQVMTIPPPVTDLDLRLRCDGSSSGTTPTPTATTAKDESEPPAQTVTNDSAASSGSGPAPTPVTTQAGARRVGSIGRVLLGRRTLKVRVGCAQTAASRCSGAVAVSYKAGKRTVHLRSVRFASLNANRGATLRLRLGRKQRQAIAGAGQVTVDVRVADASGTAQALRRTVRVKRV